MNRRALIAVIGIALLAGLYFYDRDNSTQVTRAATVVSIESQSDEGADTWHVTVTSNDQTLTLAPLNARPDIAPGDALCITQVIRSEHPDEFRRATGAASC